MSDNINILRQFNEQTNNSLSIENINYLTNLYTIINNSINQLINFNINTSKLLEIKELFGNNLSTCEFNDNVKCTTINFFRTLLNTINSLKQRPVKTKNNAIRDEYRNFHNNVICKVKEFINYYITYVKVIENIRNNLSTYLNTKIDAINILLFNYNNNSMCNADPNFYSNHLRQKAEIDLLKNYNDYLNSIIDIFIFIRTSFKDIDTKFLKLLNDSTPTTFKKGDKIYYKKESKEATIILIHNDSNAIYYTILLSDGREKQTIAQNITAI
jgi:hypothetical protein